MKKLLPLLFILTVYLSSAQENSEIYVMDIIPAYEGLQLMNVQKIENNKGYNNQPSFISEKIIIYSGENDGQTDISEYNLDSKNQNWIISRTGGGEYSPQKFPSSNDIAAVRLDNDGLQSLYRYYSDKGTSSELIPDLQVAYFAFYNDNNILATVLDGDKMDLVMIDLKTQATDTLFHNAGRSIQRIPSTKTMSYTLVNDQDNLDLYILKMNTSESFFVCELPIGIQDYVWLNDTQILIGSRDKLYMYDTLGEQDWKEVASLEDYGVKNITRLAVSPNGKKLALVAE